MPSYRIGSEMSGGTLAPLVDAIEMLAARTAALFWFDVLLLGLAVVALTLAAAALRRR